MFKNCLAYTKYQLQRCFFRNVNNCFESHKHSGPFYFDTGSLQDVFLYTCVNPITECVAVHSELLGLFTRKVNLEDRIHSCFLVLTYFQAVFLWLLNFFTKNCTRVYFLYAFIIKYGHYCIRLLLFYFKSRFFLHFLCQLDHFGFSKISEIFYLAQKPPISRRHFYKLCILIWNLLLLF